MTQWLRQVCVFLIANAFAGCGGGEAKFVPAASTAANTVRRVLTSWQNGGKPGFVTAGPPSIQVVDSDWLDGKKLTAFTIGTEEPGNGPKRIRALLTFDKGASQEVTYFVFGNDPLWVWRDKDYAQRHIDGM